MPHENIEITGTISERFLNGAKFGAGIASCASLFVLFKRAYPGNGAFERLGVSVPAVVGAYFVGFVLAGGAIGVAWPLRRSRFGAGVIAGIGAFIAYTAAGTTISGSLFRWGFTEWWCRVWWRCFGSCWAQQFSIVGRQESLQLRSRPGFARYGHARGVRLET